MGGPRTKVVLQEEAGVASRLSDLYRECGKLGRRFETPELESAGLAAASTPRSPAHS